MKKIKREEQAGAMNKKSTCPFMTAEKPKNKNNDEMKIKIKLK